MELNGFEIDRFNIYGIKDGATTSTCPKCSEDRKPQNQKAKCMSVFWDTGLGQCNHCGERVQLHTYIKKESTKTYLKPTETKNKASLSDELLTYWKDTRKISKKALDKLKISESIKWMPKANADIRVMEFPYFLNGELINIKSRGKNKDFKFEKGCELIMYNLDAIIGEKECIIVEGEPDVCAYYEAEVYNVSSVPNGFTLPKKNGTSSINLDYLDDYYHIFESKEKIYLAVDNDEAGKHGEKELIRRFGADKCYLVDFKDCKDANEYLIKYGSESLRKTIDDAEQVPLESVETINDFEEALDDFWLNGSPKGYITGIRDLDKNFSIEISQFVVIVAPPSTGKSEIADAMCLGYAMNYGFKTAFASPENKPNILHADKIIKKIVGYKPKNGQTKELIRAKNFYKEHFYHVEFDVYDLKSTLEKFKELIKRKGIRVCVIDPYNKVRLKESVGKDIINYTLDYFNEIDSFCKKNGIILILVMHPVKMKKTEGTDSFLMPSPYDVKGGGEVYDMSPHMLGFTRDKENRVLNGKILKCKFQHLGENDAEFNLAWNVNNGRYTDVNYDPLNEPQVVNWDNSDILEARERNQKLEESKERNTDKTINIFDYGEASYPPEWD